KPLQEREGLLVRAAGALEIGQALRSRLGFGAPDPLTRGSPRVGVGAPCDAGTAVAALGTFAGGFRRGPPLAITTASGAFVAPSAAFTMQELASGVVGAANALAQALDRTAEFTPTTVVAANFRYRGGAAFATRLELRLLIPRRALAGIASASRAARRARPSRRTSSARGRAGRGTTAARAPLIGPGGTRGAAVIAPRAASAGGRARPRSA